VLDGGLRQFGEQVRGVAVMKSCEPSHVGVWIQATIRSMRPASSSR
jgi:hypothetical protein